MTNIEINKLITSLRNKFAERLQAKTGWGRNDVLSEFDQAVAQALADVLEEKLQGLLLRADSFKAQEGGCK